jgi:uncharacterized protein (DUF488 family)
VEKLMKNIFTIGYQGSTISDFVLTLKTAGVELLADVRDVTVSRKKGFSKNMLTSILAEEGIRYVHFRQLGDPKAGREAARRGDYESFCRIYNDHISQTASRIALDELATLAGENLTCLMCYELEPEECHRTIVANQLVFSNFKTLNLFVNKRERYEQYPDQLPSHSHCEGSAPTQ